MTNTKTLCTYYGGSQMYHLETPESDLDERGLFMHTDTDFILGTKRFDEERKQTDDEDKVMKELSHYLTLVKKSNTEAMDVLFCDESAFLTFSPEVKLLRDNAKHLIDSLHLFNCLRGYMKGELRLACGERKGKIGGKRYAKLQEVGFSPKNVVQLMRLSQVGCTFFESDMYVVDTRMFDCKDMPTKSFDSFHEFLYEIKTNPTQFTLDDVKSFASFYEKKIVDSYENRKITYHFDERLANEILLKLYFPVLQSAYKNLQM